MNIKCKYEKPSVEVVLLQPRQQLLQTSMPIDPENPSPYQW